jgi:neutral ceramidase
MWVRVLFSPTWDFGSYSLNLDCGQEDFAMNRYSMIFMPILVLLLGGCGCLSAKIKGSLPPPAPPVASGTFQVGAAKVDITPMPGYPMAGFAAGGRISRGVWTRLYARAICFEDMQGRSMTLVSCDLWAIPGGLGDRVAELVAIKYNVPQLGREQIVLAATHTHNGPGNYATSVLYNLFASPKQGFDQDLFDFLSHRIAGAIAQAWQSRTQAALIRSEMVLTGIGRNRSMGAFLQNGPSAQALLMQNSSVPNCVTSFPAGGVSACRAIDPTLTVIRAVPMPLTPNAKPIAVVAFYAVHPTVMGSSTEVYTSDIFGVATTTLEHELGSSVVAVFNGAEGDVSADWERRDRPAALKVGKKLAGGISALLQQPGQDVTGQIRFGFVWCRLDDVAKPMAGASMFAGSEGDWTFFRDAGWREGLVETDPTRQIPGHTTKKDPLAPELIHTWVPIQLSPAIENIAKLPKQTAIGVYGLGQVTIATLPGEFTTMLGQRIAASVASGVGTTDKVLFVGLANEYVSYFTTEPEHDAQHYEGASMLYGPGSGQRIEQSLLGLANNLGLAPLRTTTEKYKYDAGPKMKFGVREFGLLLHNERMQATYNSLANVLMDETSGIPVPNYPFMVFIDKNPKWPSNPQSSDRVTPSVSMEKKGVAGFQPFQIAGVEETDEGLNFVTTVIGTFAGESRWITIWMAPNTVDPNAVLRFRVEGTSGQTFTSPEFTLDSARANWGFVGLVR